MPSKFKIGDRVRLTGHEVKIITGKARKHSYKKAGVVYTPHPEGLRLIDRNRPRTVERIKYDPSRKRNLYFLRSYDGRLSSVGFDSTQLTSERSPRPGRPRRKQKWHRKREYHSVRHRNRS